MRFRIGKRHVVKRRIILGIDLQKAIQLVPIGDYELQALEVIVGV